MWCRVHALPTGNPWAEYGSAWLPTALFFKPGHARRSYPGAFQRSFHTPSHMVAHLGSVSAFQPDTDAAPIGGAARLKLRYLSLMAGAPRDSMAGARFRAAIKATL
jgi:hypothetical protein